MTIIWFTRSLPSSISDELTRQGYTVFESLSISETLSLAEQHPTAAIIVNHDVEKAAAKVIQQHHPTLCLNPSAAVKEIVWELSSLIQTPLQ